MWHASDGVSGWPSSRGSPMPGVGSFAQGGADPNAAPIRIRGRRLGEAAPGAQVGAAIALTSIAMARAFWVFDAAPQG